MEQKRAQKQNHAYVVNKFAIKESSRCCWERTVSSVNGAGSTGEHTQKDETGPTADMTHTCALRRFSRAWLCKAHGCSPPCSSVHEILQGKNTGVHCHCLLQGIFPTQGSNPRLLLHLHWQRVLHHWRHLHCTQRLTQNGFKGLSIRTETVKLLEVVT